MTFPSHSYVFLLVLLWWSFSPVSKSPLGLFVYLCKSQHWTCTTQAACRRTLLCLLWEKTQEQQLHCLPYTLMYLISRQNLSMCASLPTFEEFCHVLLSAMKSQISNGAGHGSIRPPFWRTAIVKCCYRLYSWWHCIAGKVSSALYAGLSSPA